MSALAMIYLRLQNTVVWLFTLRQDSGILIYFPKSFPAGFGPMSHVDTYHVFSTHGHNDWLHDGRSAART